MEYAATTPVDRSVCRAMMPFLKEYFYNPAGLFNRATKLAKKIARYREMVANEFAAHRDEIIFTSGASESNALAIIGTALAYRCEFGIRPHIIISAIEHSSVRESANLLVENDLADISIVPTDESGILSPQKILESMRPETVLVSVMYVNNETGLIQPIREIAKLLRKHRRNTSSVYPYFHSDASQAINFLDINVLRMGVDILSADGSKIYGPKMSGCLFKKSSVKCQALIRGGGQELGMRSGTNSLAQIAGFASALCLTRKLCETEFRRLQSLQELFIARINKDFPKYKITNSPENSTPNIVHVRIPGARSDEYILRLDHAGVMASAGAGCSARDDAPSSTMMAMFGEEAKNFATVRFSMGRQTNRRDILRTIDAMRKIEKFFV